MAERLQDIDPLDVWARVDAVLAIMQSFDGTSGSGIPYKLTDYSGTDWNMDITSVDTTLGQTIRARSNGVIHLQADKNGLTSNLPVFFGSTLGVIGDFSVNNKFTVIASSGNTAIAGTGSVTGDFSVNNKFTVIASSGNTAIAGTGSVTGDFSVNTNKFTVIASSGNTAIAGTGSVTGDFSVNTNKFTVAASSGATSIAGALTLTGDLAINSDKFVVTASTGATSLKSHITMANNTALQMLTTGAVTRDIVTFNSSNVIVLGNSNHEVRLDGTRHGFFGATPVTKRTIGGAAVDAATTLTLANNIRTALIDLGLCQT